MRTTGCWKTPSDLPEGKSMPYGWFSSPISPLSVEIEGGTFGDFQKCICGLTEPFLWIQLVAEGSSSTWRAFGVAMAKARYHFVEGSALP